MESVHIWNNEESLRAAIGEHVNLSVYQKVWPPAFEQERERLSSVLPGSFVSIEHIGSTAVEGMCAKPIIDIMAGVNSMAQAESLIEPLCLSGYTTSREFNATLEDRKWLMRFSEGRRTHHLHVTVFEGAVWRERLNFRNILRSQPCVAARYSLLKAQLAVVHETDREAYTEAKSKFVRSVIAAA